jgi:uncharacterized repeat protein (TIGR04138 family)
MPGEPEISKEEVIRKDGRYPVEAYQLMEEGMLAAVREKYGGEAPGEEAGQHVSGRELCMGIRQVLLDRYGMLARAVMARWNVRATIDFGNMVYLLIQHQFMRKTNEDSLEDFRNVFDFQRDLSADDNFELKD